MNHHRAARIAGVFLTLYCGCNVTQAAAWDEGADGDLSSIQSAPTTLLLSAGSNAVSGTVGGSDGQDWITLTVPLGFEMSALELTLFNSTTDSTAFTGLSHGIFFTGDVLSGEDYLGYTHFGPGSVGTNLLPALSTANLAQGFTPPLPTGAYAFLIQQTGPVTSAYTFDYRVTAVPEVSGTALLGLSGFVLCFKRSRPWTPKKD